MISANRKRRFSKSFLSIPKGTVSNKKIPVYANQVRKKHLNKVLALQTYMEESQRKSQIKTGLPLLDALNIISDTSENVTIKYVFKET